MASYLIKDTTREERERIVAEALGNISAACDGCSAGIVEMYQEYIDGLKELREVNMAFNSRYVSGRQGPPERTGCGMGR
ncbi:MAG: purine biosynthesis protein PurH [Aristaeellaceae bacterium]